eukprot:g15844.t1
MSADEAEKERINGLLEKATQLKTEGNACFKEKKYADAIRHYSKIFAYTRGIKAPQMGIESMLGAGRSFPASSEQTRLVEELTLSANLNLALCYAKDGKGVQAVKFASEVLKTSGQDENVKALSRRGHGYYLMGDYSSAEEDLERANKLCPGDPGIERLLKQVRKKVKGQEAQLAKRMQSAFGTRSIKSGATAT